jgi:pimeloyl-ACP methyl ester carboxylesterase
MGGTERDHDPPHAGHDEAGHGADGHGDDPGHAHGHDAHGHDAHGHDAASPYPPGFAVIPDLEPADHHHGHGHAHGPELRHEAELGPPRRYVEVGDITFATIDVGEGLPVLFLHGFPTSAALWRGVIERLEGRFRCVAPDLPGFGETECPADGAFDLGAQADAVEALLDALGIDRYAVVGHDWGGVIAMILAARHGDRIRQLTLIDAIGFDHTPPLEVRWLARAGRFSAVFDLLCETGFMRAFAHGRFGVRRGAAEARTISTEFIDHCIAPLYRETPPAYRAPRERFRQALVQVVAEAPGVWQEPSRKLADFAGPALVVWGCDDPYISVSVAKQMADSLTGLTGLELLPRCGHWVPEEAPERLAEILLAHLPAREAVGAAADAAGAAV